MDTLRTFCGLRGQRYAGRVRLAAGEKLGPYEVLHPLGAGGMGEVNKARDTRLDRTVAVKVLPEEIAQREDLRARFEREARAVACCSIRTSARCLTSAPATW